MDISRAFAIFSGFNERAVIAFCRFATINKIKFYIIASGYDDSIFTSKYSVNVEFIRENSKLEKKQILDVFKKIKTKRNLQELIILPSTEFLNRFFLEHIEEFKAENIIIPLVDKPLYELISDKFLFSEHCSEEGLLVPKTYKLNEIENFPIVIKPKHYFDKKNNVLFKPKIIFDRSEFDKVVKEIDIDECYFQEYISGRSFYLLFYVSKNQNDIVYSQENLIQQAEGASIVLAISSDIHKTSICQNYLQLLNKLHFYGLVMIELRYFNDNYYMIEANPRLWGPSQLFVDSNVPIFNQFVKELGFKCKNAEDTKDAFYFWYGGIIKDIFYSSNKLAFYNYDEEKLASNLDELLKHDIYKRNDTIKIFCKEVL